mmetsp:Transcript_9828/g.20423  ORF Transcript_9828/g.20423 Transcript_9828/m.20423 type:complete len:371 (-) Transcript_9828:27-1139(-)
MSRRTSRKRKDSDEWSPDGDKQYSDNESSIQADPEPDSQKSESDAQAASLIPLSKPKRRRKKVFVIDEEEEAQPTYTRKTNKGGYAHTNLSKSRISKANSGNKPWNFGKRRSSADKAKIAAGVRARNRTILLQKLKRLGMTEEEHMLKKKEIKYLRERIRRAKLANKNHRDKKLEKKLQDVIDSTNVKNVNLDEREEEEEQETPEKEEKKEEKVIEAQVDRSAEIFSKDITWRSLPEETSEDESCPTGGPGGLICCESCSARFNLLLTRTSEDVESHRMIKESGEVTEILGLLAQKKSELKEAVNVASKKIPPLPPAGSGRLMADSHVRMSSNGNRKPSYKLSDKVEIYPGAWDLTSAIDLGVIGGIASV